MKVYKLLQCCKLQCHIQPIQTYSTKTDWANHTFVQAMPSCGGKEIAVEYGCVTLAGSDDSQAAILAVHPAGSSYRQFSKLPGYVGRGYAGTLVGLNMLGYGRSGPWDGGQGTPTMEDLVGMVDGVMAAEGRSQDWHFLGHSMGGGLLLAAAGSRPQMNSKLVSLSVFEPNLFSLLIAGNREEREQARAGEKFFRNMLDAADREDWEAWGQTFYHFWFTGDWGGIDEGARAKLVNTTLPNTIHEIQALQWAMEQGEEYADMLLRNLMAVKGRKRIILSHNPGPGSKPVSQALADVLKRKAGFEILVAPAGGHMGPVTHPQQVLPLLLG